MKDKKSRTMAAQRIEQRNYNTPEYEFSAAIQNDTGADLYPVADGLIHRFDDPKGKSGNKAGWYVFYVNADGFAAGVYGNWRTGLQVNWNNARSQQGRSCGDYTAKALAHNATLAEKVKAKHKCQSEAALKACQLWVGASPSAVNHPYLIKKRVSATGLKTNKGSLLVPMKDVHCNLVNVQSIYANGDKRFLKGAKVLGAFFLIGVQKIQSNDLLYVCEGVATGLTVWDQLKCPVVCAMTAVNLLPVCKALREKYPRIQLIIAADNDHRTQGNPGITKAKEAARDTGAGLTWPPCCGDNCTCTDFNDLANCNGFGGGA